MSLPHMKKSCMCSFCAAHTHTQIRLCRGHPWQLIQSEKLGKARETEQNTQAYNWVLRPFCIHLGEYLL